MYFGERKYGSPDDRKVSPSFLWVTYWVRGVSRASSFLTLPPLLYRLTVLTLPMGLVHQGLGALPNIHSYLPIFLPIYRLSFGMALDWVMIGLFEDLSNRNN